MSSNIEKAQGIVSEINELAGLHIGETMRPTPDILKKVSDEINAEREAELKERVKKILTGIIGAERAATAKLREAEAEHGKVLKLGQKARNQLKAILEGRDLPAEDPQGGDDKTEE
ncbi:MAG: hypothetical protein WC381_11630 [Kiritimatiellia bacterium]|jgi:hypothetical protein